LTTTGLPTGFGAGLAGLFVNSLRTPTGGAALARAATDGFDFATVFLNFDAALAMTYNQSAKGGEMRAYTTFCRFRARREAGLNVTYGAI
jgi:hypothetical protein